MPDWVMVVSFPSITVVIATWLFRTALSRLVSTTEGGTIATYMKAVSESASSNKDAWGEGKRASAP